MKESVFAGEMKKSLMHYYGEALYVKIPDSIGQRFGTEKFFDAFFYINGRFFALEYKQHKSHRAFPLSKIRPIQEEYLQKAKNNGGHAYFVFNIRYKESERVDIAIFIDIDRWNILRQELSSRKSIPLDDLMSNGTTISYQYIDRRKIWNIVQII